MTEIGFDPESVYHVVELVEEISQFCRLGLLSSKSSLVSFVIVLAFVHHLTELNTFLLGSWDL